MCPCDSSRTGSMLSVCKGGITYGYVERSLDHGVSILVLDYAGSSLPLKERLFTNERLSQVHLLEIANVPTDGLFNIGRCLTNLKTLRVYGCEESDDISLIGRLPWGCKIVQYGPAKVNSSRISRF